MSVLEKVLGLLLCGRSAIPRFPVDRVLVIEMGAPLAARLELLGEGISIQSQAAVLAPVQVVDERLVKG